MSDSAHTKFVKIINTNSAEKICDIRPFHIINGRIHQRRPKVRARFPGHRFIPTAGERYAEAEREEAGYRE
jgi:hypothetical protein